MLVTSPSGEMDMEAQDFAISRAAIEGLLSEGVHAARCPQPWPSSRLTLLSIPGASLFPWTFLRDPADIKRAEAAPREVLACIVTVPKDHWLRCAAHTTLGARR